MIIELSGVQIGLKSYVCFQSERVRFEITSMISAQNCSTRRKFSCHFITSILKSHNLICRTMTFLSFIFLQCDWLVWKSLKIWLVVLFYCPILIGWEKDEIWRKTLFDWWRNRIAESQSHCKDRQWFQIKLVISRRQINSLAFRPRTILKRN